ncbi:MAG: hypothetical protein ACRELF_25360 [Gemmataceae bacterium]
MSKSKPGYTLEQHRELGRLLSGMRDRLTTEFTKLANAYRLETRAAKTLQRVIDQMDATRNDLENLVIAEQVTAGCAKLGAYYPPSEARVTDFG